MTSYALGALLVGIVALLWRVVRRPLAPNQLAPMTPRWLHEIRRQRES